MLLIKEACIKKNAALLEQHLIGLGYVDFYWHQYT
jgi:hypothetical protein